MFANVAIAVPLHQLFTYKIPEGVKLSAGMRVLVPFHHRKTVGYVMETSNIKNQKSNIEIKEIISVLDDEPVFSKEMQRLINWIADYYCAPIGEVCRASLPKGLTRPPKQKRGGRPPAETVIDNAFARASGISLTESQSEAYNNLKSAIQDQKFSTTLLYGVTGSGKTEIYLRCFADVMARGEQGLFLVPEIGLTPQFLGYLSSHLKNNVEVYHSGLTDAQRLSIWTRITSGKTPIVVGTRSAVFAPFRKLGLIVVDEEHDGSYKQEESPRYNGRDTAIMRAKICGIPCILGSATPSIESFFNARTKKYHYIHLPERPAGAVLPDVEVVNMCGAPKGSSLSTQSISAVAEALAKKEQVMIFLNRRGFASFVICNACGHVFKCPNCNISLTYHRQSTKLLCHYCDYDIAVPQRCEKCANPDVSHLGMGTERIESELSTLFPQARIARLDRDIASKKGARPEILSKMKRGEVDILIGTQMITKGHDFPNVTLVLIVDADLSINFPDFRSAERTFQLLTQVSGRAGRAKKSGRVIIQTYSPEHHAIETATRHDFNGFCENEIKTRRELSYPPFSRLALVRIQGAKENAVQKTAEDLIKHLQSPGKIPPFPLGSGPPPAKVDEASGLFNVATKGPDPIKGGEGGLTILGPAPAPLSKVRGRHRWQILIKSGGHNALRETIANVLANKPPRGVQVTVDVDPVNML